MKYLIATFFILFFFTSSPAQPAGYLGKRFTLSYEQLTGPNFINILELPELSLTDGAVSETNANWNYIGSVTMDYVVGKTKSRGISISAVDQTMYFDDYNTDTTYSYGYPQLNSTYFLNSAKLTGFTIGAYVKYFKKQYTAPFGEYYKFELLYSYYHIKTFKQQAQLYELSKPYLEPFSTMGFAVTYGKNRIFWDKVVVSMGITVGLRLSILTQVFSGYESNEYRAAYIDLKSAAEYWHGQNLFYNLHLGVGLLLF